MDTEWLSALPKVELHLHLEGSVEPADLQRLAQRNHLPDAAWPPAAFQERYHYSDFQGFLQSFKFITEHLIQPEDYGWIASRLIDRLERAGVLYAEIFFSAGIVFKQKKDLEAIVSSLRDASAAAERREKIHINWIFDLVRQFGAPEAERVVEAARQFRAAGWTSLVGVGMGGDENSIPAMEFRAAFSKARAAGLHVTIHAGEVGGPDSIWDAVNLLGAERIGHGIAACDDLRLMDFLRERSILLECAPSSNLATGAVARLEDHPLRLFFDHGLLVCLNTDDPPLFQTDVLEEYRRAAQWFGFGREDFIRMNRDALEGCFAEEAQKTQLRNSFERRLAALNSGAGD